jgi:hypothetical protein
VSRIRPIWPVIEILQPNGNPLLHNAEIPPAQWRLSLGQVSTSAPGQDLGYHLNTPESGSITSHQETTLVVLKTLSFENRLNPSVFKGLSLRTQNPARLSAFDADPDSLSEHRTPGLRTSDASRL